MNDPKLLGLLAVGCLAVFVAHRAIAAAVLSVMGY